MNIPEFIQSLPTVLIPISISFAWFIGSFFILWIFRTFILHRLKKLTKSSAVIFDDAIFDALQSLRFRFYLAVSSYISLYSLQEGFYGMDMLQLLLVVLLFSECIRAFAMASASFIDAHVNKNTKKTEQAHTQSMFHIFRMIGLSFLWIIGSLLILSNFGINVASLIASLGIGGIAIALALQNVLGDLFSSFSLFIDKPFQIGDSIQIGDKFGVVKKIWMKTTRISLLQGEELIISNRELTSAQVQNFGRLKRRRDVIHFGVVYHTKTAQLKELPQMVQHIVEHKEQASFGRCHLKSLEDSSLLYELVYSINSGDYQVYMDIRQEILLDLIALCEKNNIEFAYPTQTIHLEK